VLLESIQFIFNGAAAAFEVFYKPVDVVTFALLSRMRPKPVSDPARQVHAWDQDRCCDRAKKWIEVWYICERRHSSLGFLAPAVFEAKHLTLF
jgi:hypothetical protein